jgi:putative membrane protein
MKAGRRPPQAFRLPPEETGAAPAKPAARSRPPRAPRTLPAERIEWQAEDVTAGPAAPARPAAQPAGRRRWGTLFFAALSAFLALAVGQWAYRLIEDLFARAAWLGWTASGLLALAGLAALAIALREALALARLGTLERLQADAAHAIAADDGEAAGRVLAGLKRIYAGRADAAWGLARLTEHEGDIIDAGDRIRMAERDLVAPLDEEARRVIARAARRVTLLTTVAPHAALDIVFVATLNLKMLRELAGLYGGRPGTLGTARLARMVLGHLAVTGGLALSDTLIQQVVGRGLAGRLSARLGEGAVNGILTARIGRAALDLTRPLPFVASRPPTLTDLMREVANLAPPESGAS